MAVDPKHSYSTEPEKASWGIYDDFKLWKLFGLHGFYEIFQRFKGFKSACHVYSRVILFF